MTRREESERRLDRAKAKGRTTEAEGLERDLAMPDFPFALAYIWRTYFRIRRRMGLGFNGPNPIGWQDIDAFIRRSGMRLTPWEIEVLEGVDDAYLEATSAAKKKQTAMPGVVAQASMDDPKAVRSVLAGIGQRRAGRQKA